VNVISDALLMMLMPVKNSFRKAIQTYAVQHDHHSKCSSLHYAHPKFIRLTSVAAVLVAAAAAAAAASCTVALFIPLVTSLDSAVE